MDFTIRKVHFSLILKLATMKNIKVKFLIIMLFFLFNGILFGQSKKSSIKDIKGSFVSARVNYISDAVFLGRKDSIEAPYLYPSITYHHKSGFYTEGSFSYLTKSNESRIDLFLITAGLDFEVDKFSGDISGTKYFFNNDSYNVISEVQADLTAKFNYDFNIVNLSLIASTYFSKNSNSDFFLSSEISHDFISSDTKFQISPTAGIYFGTQNFYEDYYIQRQITKSGGGTGSGSGMGGDNVITKLSIQESEKFNLMAYELSLPMWYTNNSFTISFLPALVFPQSEANIIDGETVVKENLDETFYWMVGLSYQFN